MAFPEPVARKLQRTLGVEGEILVTWLEEERAERERLRAEVREEFTQMRRDMAAMETRLADRIQAVDSRVAALEVRISDVKSDLMKWSFVFWVGAVAAIALLAGMLDR
jgi:hypothetical protein